MHKTLKTLRSTLFGALAALTLSAAPSRADVITLQPADDDLADLDHYYAYAWSINRPDLAGKTLIGATLHIDNIRDWTIESNDVLYIQLMNLWVNSAGGVTTYYDNQASGNLFGGIGINLHAYHDLLPYTQAELNSLKTVDLTYTFSAGELATLATYLADGKFALGFDPDCHYYNDGIKLTLTTAATPPPVPEPGTFALMGLGLAAAGLLARRRKA